MIKTRGHRVGAINSGAAAAFDECRPLYAVVIVGVVWLGDNDGGWWIITGCTRGERVSPLSSPHAEQFCSPFIHSFIALSLSRSFFVQ